VANTIYFLGAGASREAGVPTQKEIWEQIEAVGQKTGEQRICTLLDFAVYLNFGQPGQKVAVDTAELLTLIDLALEQNVSVGKYQVEDLRSIRETLIRVICKILEASVKPERLDVFAGFCTRLAQEDTIISLNYDTVIDHILTSFVGQVTYGFNFAAQLGEGSGKKSKGTQLLLKPHGSLNWRYCSRCNNIYLLAGEKSDCFDGPDQRCPADEHPLLAVVVTPSYRKQFLVPQLHDVWMQCFHQIKNADVINFVGYSFPPGDVHIIHLIKRAVLAGEKRPVINVISRDSQGMVFDRCQNIFAGFKYFQTSFGHYFCDMIN